MTGDCFIHYAEPLWPNLASFVAEGGQEGRGSIRLREADQVRGRGGADEGPEGARVGRGHGLEGGRLGASEVVQEKVEEIEPTVGSRVEAARVSSR